VDDTRPLKQDGLSMLVVRAGFWCADDDPRRQKCHDPTLQGMTQLYPVQNLGQPDDGSLREADVELNAVNFAWSLDGERPGTRSLRALIAHELGHVLGLDHLCNPREAVVLKTAGNPTAPICEESNTHASIMFPTVEAEVGHRSITPGTSETTLLCKLYEQGKSRSP
jgi:hypothetical protein